MTKKRVFFMAVFVALAVISLGRADRTPMSKSLRSQGYRKAFTKNNVTVYKYPKSAILRYAAEGEFSHSPDDVLQALLSYSKHAKYIPRVSESRVINRGDNWMVVYQRLNLPVISDRDMVLFVRWGKKDKVRWVEYRAVTNRGPKPKKGIVRLSLHRGSWQLKPVDQGSSTFARFQFSTDMAGSLPGWMARSGSGDEIPKTFVGIRKLIAASK